MLLRFTALASLAALIAALGAGCDPPAKLDIALPAGLPLADLPEAQQALLRATIAVSDGALVETDVVLANDSFKLSGDFALQNVVAAGKRTLTLRVYGRIAQEAPAVLLGVIDTAIDVTPAQATAVSFAKDAAFQTCNEGADGKCSLLFDENRNGTSNILDLIGGIDPSPQAPFVEVSPSTLQFPSGIRLGTFARQVIVLENRGSHPMRVLRAETVDGQGVSLSLFDPTGVQVTAPRRILAESALALEVQPAAEAFIAVSFAPVNSFLTTGAVQVVVQDTVTLVTQTARAKVIANADGALRPPGDYLPPLALDSPVANVPVIAFPPGPLFSGLAITSIDAGATSGLARVGGVLSPEDEDEDGTILVPADVIFLVNVPAGHRFSTSLGGLTSDIDLAVIDLAAGAPNYALACPTCFSSNAGTSPESAELINDTTATLNIAIVLGRVDLQDIQNSAALAGDDDRVPFELTAHLTKGPEFLDGDQAVSPNDGPLEGGTLVTLRGRGFLPGATVTFADSLALDVSITQEASGESTVSLTLPPGSLETGKNPATIVVTNPSPDNGGDGQAATLPEGFTYQAPAPRLTSVTPKLSTTTGTGLPVTIDGAFFSARFGNPVVSFGEIVVEATFVNAARLQVLPPALPADAQGEPLTVVLTVSNCVQPDAETPDVRRLGSPSNIREFRFVVPIGDPPTISGVSPDGGSIEGGDTITITGSGLREGATVLIGGVEAESENPTDGDTRITATTPARANDGSVDIVVVNDDGQSGTLANGFSYAIPAPTIASVFPERAVTGGGTLLVVTGTGFRDGVRATFQRGATTTVIAENVTRVSSTALLVLTPAFGAGASTIAVENLDGQRADSGDTFEFFVAAGEGPAIVGLDPLSGDVGGGYDVSILGDRFAQPTVIFGDVILEGDELVVTDGATGAFDRITFVAPAASTGVAGVITVQVVNGDRQSDSAAFAYVVVPVSPRIDSLQPARLSSTGTTLVSMRGANLGDAVEVFAGGLSIPFAVRTSLEIEATVPASPEGSLSLSIETATGKVASIIVQVIGDPEVLSLSSSTLHADVAGNQVLIFGKNLDASPLSGVTIGAQPTNVLVIDESFLLLELPAIVPVVAVHFTLSYENGLQAVSPDIGVHTPTVVFIATEGPDQLGRLSLSLFGDFLNAERLTGVRLLNGNVQVSCALQSKSESSISCLLDSSLFSQQHDVTLDYSGTFAGAPTDVSISQPFACTNDGCAAL